MIRMLLLVELLLTWPVSAASFTLQQAMSAPFPSALSVCPTSGKVAWVLNEKGARNVWVAEAPNFSGRRLTSFTADDGQEIDQISWMPDAQSVIYVRGGDFERGSEALVFFYLEEVWRYFFHHRGHV